MAKKTPKAVPATLTKLREVKIEQYELPTLQFETAADFKAEYDVTDSAVKQAAEASVDKQVELIAALAKMRSLLSQRSIEKIRREAGVKQGWVQYFQWFKRTYEYPSCLRTVINKIDRLSGKKFCRECNKANGHTPSCSKNKVRPLTYLESRLIGSVNAAHELVSAIRNSGNVYEFVREFERHSPTPQRLEEFIERGRMPLDLKPEEIVRVDGRKYTISEVQGVAETDEGLVLTIFVQPVHKAPHPPAAAAVVVMPTPATTAHTANSDGKTRAAAA